MARTINFLSEKLWKNLWRYIFWIGFIFIANGEPNNGAPGPPTIIEHPLDILVVKDDPVTLRCQTSGENSQITWYKDGNPVNVGNGHRLLLPNGSLFLLKVNSGGKDSDAGSYYCVAKNEYGEVRSQEANVKIAMLRDDFRVRPRNVQAVIGSRAIMECSPPRGVPEPVVTWKKDEKELRIQDDNRISIHPAGNLIIENVQRSDSGFYQCVAANMVGERISNPARLSVYEKPRFLAEPKDVVAEVGTSVLFDCRVAGEPMPSISWKKMNDQMPIGRAYITQDSRGLRIDRIQSSDEGEYVCHAKNPAGNIEASAKLRVNSPPTFSKKPEDVRVSSGKPAMFDCEAVGQPQPGIFWSKEGDQQFTFFPGLVSPDGRIRATKEGRLIIEDTRPVDQGTYICAATNAAGSTLAKATLAVASKASQSYPPPVIQYGHQNQTLMVDDMAILPCQATGRSAPKISWLKNGLVVNFTEGDLNYDYRYRQLTTGTLQISDLKKSDTGVYTCRAKNEDGEATWTASLIVEEHTNPTTLFQRMPDAGTFPSAPGKPIVHNVTDEGAELEWTPPDKHGATPVVGYILQYWSPELGETWYNVLDVVPSTRFRVKSLLPNHSYVFVVRAENSNGIGPPSALSEIVLTKASKHDVDKDDIFSTMDMESARQKLAAEQLIKLIEVKAINATAMSLTWKRQKNEPLVQGYYIKWRGPPLTPDHSWVNVSDPRTQTVLINGLKPFTNYEFFVIPYHRTIQGMPSNSLDGTTYEAPPSLPPTNVRVRMLNLTTLRVLWRPPTADGINGILKGYQILIIGNTTEYSRNISTNERAASVTLFHLNPGKTYKVRVAAKTLAGIGVYHGTDTVTMNEETLREHLRLANEGSDEGIWYILRRPWAIALLGIILWLIIVAFAVLVWYRWKNRRGKAGRNGMPFIKINDGSVLFTARDGFWLTGQHYGQHNQAQSLHSDQTNPMTPNQSEYYAAGPIPHLARAPYPGTLARTQSPHHYHYAQLPEGCLQNGMSTFYGMGRPEYQDDPSPYATTTLVMNGHSHTQPRFKRHDSANLHSPLPQPRLPTGPIPSGPPQHLLATVASNGSSGDGVILSDGYPTNKRGHNTQQELCQLGNGMNPRSSSRGALAGFHNSNSLHSSDSPHTDVSFVQSSDGTNGSGKGRTMNRGSPPRHILDFVPPPPPTEPPPHFDHTDVSNGYRPDYRDANGRKLTSGGENYDSVSDLLLAQNNGYHPSPQPRDHSLYNGHSQHASTSTPKQFAKNRSRNGLRKYEKNGRRSRGTDDDESQRSSLMGGDEDDADDEGGIASHQITYDSDMDGGELSDGEVGTNRKSRRSNADSSFTHRPNVPVMGVSASTLSQSSYDASLPGTRRSASRIKSLPRNSSKKDIV